MLKFFLTFITRLLARFLWIGVGFAIVALFGRGQRARQVKTSLMVLRKLGRF
jgi:hypothetical protein